MTPNPPHTDTDCRRRGCGVCKLAARRAAAARRVPLPARRVACVHLGPKAKPNCGCTDRHCLAGRGVVRLTAECQTCDGYESRRASPHPSDH